MPGSPSQIKKGYCDCKSIKGNAKGPDSQGCKIIEEQYVKTIKAKITIDRA